MRMLVTGGRDFIQEDFVNDTLDQIAIQRGVTHLIVGDARGVDTLATCWAIKNGISNTIYEAQWAQFSLGAGPQRAYAS